MLVIACGLAGAAGLTCYRELSELHRRATWPDYYTNGDRQRCREMLEAIGVKDARDVRVFYRDRDVDVFVFDALVEGALPRPDQAEEGCRVYPPDYACGRYRRQSGRLLVMRTRVGDRLRVAWSQGQNFLASHREKVLSLLKADNPVPLRFRVVTDRPNRQP